MTTLENQAKQQLPVIVEEPKEKTVRLVVIIVFAVVLGVILMLVIVLGVLLRRRQLRRRRRRAEHEKLMLRLAAGGSSYNKTPSRDTKKDRDKRASSTHAPSAADLGFSDHKAPESKTMHRSGTVSDESSVIKPSPRSLASMQRQPATPPVMPPPQGASANLPAGSAMAADQMAKARGLSNKSAKGVDEAKEMDKKRAAKASTLILPGVERR